MLIGCPWGYEEQELDHMRTCLPNRAVLGLGDIKLTEEDWSEILYGPTAEQATVRAPRSMGSMNVSAGLTPAQAGQPFDYSWLMYAGIGIVALMLLSKGRR